MFLKFELDLGCTELFQNRLNLALSYTITYKSRLTQKKLHNKTDGNLVSMGKTGLSHDIFF